jgi:hypothetical protein
MIVLFVSVQLALIGQASLGLGQMNYQGARYAAVHPCATANDVANYMVKVGSPTITKNCGAHLTSIVMTQTTQAGVVTSSTASGSFCTAIGCSGAPRGFGDQVKIGITYSLADQLFLPNGVNGFLGIHFPTTLTSTESAMVE